MRFLGPAVLVLVLVAAGCSSDDSGGDEGAPSNPAPEGVEGALAIRADGDRQHIDGDIDYSISPPVGGDHAPIWANCKFYAEAIPTEAAVHSLEHGAVWVTYQPGVSEEDKAAIQELADDVEFVLGSEFADQSSPVVLTAWERRLEVDTMGDPRVQEFVDTYLVGPTTPEQGAPCTGGAG